MRSPFINNLKVKELSLSENTKVMDNGNKFNKDTTLIFQLENDKSANSGISISLFSEKELVIINQKNLPTISYLNSDDQTTLNSVKDIYTLLFPIYIKLDKRNPPNSLLVDSNNVDITYVNKKYGFSLVFPSYWKDKYRIEEFDVHNKNMGVVRIFHKPTWLKEGAGTLFQITVYKSKDEWNTQGKISEETVGLRKIYESDKEVFGFSCPTDVQYIPEDKELCNEYEQMEDDTLSKVVQTFKIIN